MEDLDHNPLASAPGYACAIPIPSTRLGAARLLSRVVLVHLEELVARVAAGALGLLHHDPVASLRVDEFADGEEVVGDEIDVERALGAATPSMFGVLGIPPLQPKSSALVVSRWMTTTRWISGLRSGPEATSTVTTGVTATMKEITPAGRSAATASTAPKGTT